MELIADILMISGSFVMAIYCLILSKRLSRFTDLEKGVGGAIAVLSAQVDDMTKSLNSAQNAATLSAKKLESLSIRAESVSRNLEILIASTHDLELRDILDKPLKQKEKTFRGDLESSEAVFTSKRSRHEVA